MRKQRIVSILKTLTYCELFEADGVYCTDNYIILIKTVSQDKELKVIKYTLAPSNNENWATFKNYFFAKNI